MAGALITMSVVMNSGYVSANVAKYVRYLKGGKGGSVGGVRAELRAVAPNCARRYSPFEHLAAGVLHPEGEIDDLHDLYTPPALVRERGQHVRASFE